MLLVIFFSTFRIFLYFSSPEAVPGGGGLFYFSSSPSVPSPRRKHYRKGANYGFLQLYSKSGREGPTRSFPGSLSLHSQRQRTWT